MKRFHQVRRLGVPWNTIRVFQAKWMFYDLKLPAMRWLTQRFKHVNGTEKK